MTGDFALSFGSSRTPRILNVPVIPNPNLRQLFASPKGRCTPTCEAERCPASLQAGAFLITLLYPPNDCWPLLESGRSPRFRKARYGIACVQWIRGICYQRRCLILRTPADIAACLCCLVLGSGESAIGDGFTDSDCRIDSGVKYDLWFSMFRDRVRSDQLVLTAGT